MLSTYFLCSAGTMALLRVRQISPSAGIRPVPITKSRISLQGCSSREAGVGVLRREMRPKLCVWGEQEGTCGVH
jgi:hypothetical protein